MLLDGLHEMQVRQVLAPAAVVGGSDVNSKAVDRELSRASSSIGTYRVGGLGAGKIIFIFNVGNAGDSWDDSTTYFNLKLQESDDSTDGNDGTWTDVTTDMGLLSYSDLTLDSDKQIQLTSGSTSDLQAYALGYSGDARMVRAVLDKVGTHSTGTYINIVAVMLGLDLEPATHAA